MPDITIEVLTVATRFLDNIETAVGRKCANKASQHDEIRILLDSKLIRFMTISRSC